MARKEESLREKVKNLFIRRDTSFSVDFESMKIEPHIISSETLKDISCENSANHRVKHLKELCDIVLEKKLIDNTVEDICYRIVDMISSHHPLEIRHEIFHFYVALIHGQKNQMYMLRSYLFKVVFMHNIPEDLFPRFELLKALSENGKSIGYFEYEIGPFVLNWFPEFMGTSMCADYLSLVTILVKYNAAYLDDNIIEGFIQNILSVCSKTTSEDEIHGSLVILEAILCYSHIPQSVLLPFMCSLCLTVNIERFTQFSWKQMRNLLGTNIGHTGIADLCHLIQNPCNHENVALIRGAIYYIGMALWGPTSVPTLIHPPGAVLPSFLKVLVCNNKIVAYEVVLALLRLVKENGDQIKHRSLIWDSLFEIIDKVLDFPEIHSGTLSMSIVAKAVHEFISIAEDTCPEDSYEALFSLIDKWAPYRSEQSVIRLIVYKAENIKSYKPDFLLNLNSLLENFFKNESRPLVQLQVLKIISQVRTLNIRFTKEDAIDQTILQNMSSTPTMVDAEVRKAAVNLLISMALSCTNSGFYEILDILKKILNQMLEKIANPLFNKEENEFFGDAVAAVEGLANVFQKKLFFMASDHCIEVFSLLVEHLENQYKNLSFAQEAILVRKLILEFLFEIRANRHKQIGVLSSEGVYYSVYILCDSGSCEVSSPVGSPPSSPLTTPSISYLNFNRGYQAIITCLKEEKDWGVLQMALKKLPLILWNKTLIVESNCSISVLCTTLCHMISDSSFCFPECLKNTKGALTRTDVQCHIYPCLAALTSYHSTIAPHIQRVLIRCLESGLVSRSAKVCIEGLTLCILEMRTSMVKLLPNVLLKLSKISATKGVALPVLEFLSSLIRLPYLYGSFVEDQYMSIFAMALPYTNPFKFNQYTVALAHHVLSMWFLKCRIPFRREFANFIIKGLRGNLNVPKERQNRSEEDTESAKNLTKSIIDLHVELLEVGLDLMSRFTFGMCTNVPQRCAIAEFLLEKGQKTSWVVGNKIITVTTSGCGTKAFKQGLCKRCITSSHDTEPSESDIDSAKTFSAGRKRHQSAIQKPTSTLSKDLISGAHRTKDDSAVRYQRSNLPSRRHTSYLPDTDRFTESTSEGDEAKACSCWCTNWAEVHIRRPTGNISWMMKRQNRLLLPAPPDIPLSVLNSLTLPYRENQPDDDPFYENESLFLMESQLNEPLCEGAIEITQKTNVPIRRTNSSPDMGAGWMGPTEDPEQEQGKAKTLKLSATAKARCSSVQPFESPPEPNVEQQSFRDRGHTISVMSPVRPSGSTDDPQVNYRSGMSPNFVFLQLFHNSIFCQQAPKPLLLSQTEANHRSLTVLDHIPPYDTHRIGVIYVGPGQEECEVSILSNEGGSARYVRFLRGLGRIIPLSSADPHTTFLGGLDTRGGDGRNALVWHDDVMQVVFHVSTLMVNKESDKMRHEKKKHIGNDCVMIVFNESGQDYKINTIKGHVTNACIIITPEDLDSNVVTVKHKTPELTSVFGHTEPCIVSDVSLPIYVRQLALHANLASLLFSRQQQSAKYTQVSNWIERLRAITRLRKKLEEEIKHKKDESIELKGSCDADDFDSFTDYV